MYVARKLVYLIVRASNQLAVNVLLHKLRMLQIIVIHVKYMVSSFELQYIYSKLETSMFCH